MTKVRKITRSRRIDLSKYHNSETGEVLNSELKKGTSITVKEQTNLVTLHSDNYAVIESQAMLIMTQILNNSDLANVMKMSIITKTPLNVVYNNNVPHTNETLQKYLELKSESRYIQLIRRLMKAGILYQIKGLIYGEVRVCYLLNPFISRKRKTIDRELTEIFSEFKQIETKSQLLGS